jgi:nucleotide-binding universal stress UspA family protein
VKLDRIVVGVDGSENSVDAVAWAAGIAAATGAEVIAVHAVGLLEHVGPDETVPAASHREEIRARFEDQWCAPLGEAGVRCRRLLRDGSPMNVLLALAEEEDADLIVVGSRGMGGYPELLLGSTSTQVAQHARCPVTVVPDVRSPASTAAATTAP